MKLNMIILTAIATLAISAPALAQSDVNSGQVQADAPAFERWEYLYAAARLATKQKILGQKTTWVLTINNQDEPLAAAMNRLGSQGWELAVAYVEDASILETTYVFKRKIMIK